MREYGIQKALQGDTTLEEVIATTTTDMRMVEQELV